MQCSESAFMAKMLEVMPKSYQNAQSLLGFFKTWWLPLKRTNG